MKAILMHQPGAADTLELADIPIPEITGAHQIRIRLKAAGVNPVDTKLRSRGTYFPDNSPCILGCDGAGIVDAVGDAVTRFKPGDEVYYCYGGIGGTSGSYAEYNVVDEHAVAFKPGNLSFTEAAAAPLVLITAWESLYDRGQIRPGHTVLVHAGAGGVGHIAIQLASLQDCDVATTVSSDEKAKLVENLGCDLAINYHQDNFVDAVMDWTDGQGAAVIFDTVGGKTFEESFRCARKYGRVVTLLEPAPDTSWKVARLRNLNIGLELMLTPMYEQHVKALAHQGRILQECARHFDSNELKIHLSRVLPFEQAGEAHRLVEQGHTAGKVVLEIDT